MKTIIRTRADIEETASNYNKTDTISELKATALPLDAIANFCKIVELDGTPPKWMTRFLANCFADFLGNGGDKSMESCFNITPKQFSERKPDNTGELMESYAMLKYLFDMTHNKTAEVIKLWYEYPHETGTLTQQFQRVYQTEIYGDDWRSRLDEEMTVPVRANQFLEKMKVDHPPVFQKLKACKNQFKPKRDYPAFK